MRNIKNITEIVNELIRKEARNEAIEILTKCSEAHFNEFMGYYNTDKGNLCCLVLDTAKNELVSSNKMIYNKEDYFGLP